MDEEMKCIDCGVTPLPILVYINYDNKEICLCCDCISKRFKKLLDKIKQLEV